MASAKAAQEAFARDVLRYFLRHPKAVDSLDGVVKWRLTEEKVYQTVRATQRALQLLVAQGYLVERRSRVAGTLFALNSKKRREAERFARGERQKQ
jgi:hypothetical protein